MIDRVGLRIGEFLPLILRFPIRQCRGDGDGGDELVVKWVAKELFRHETVVNGAAGCVNPVFLK